MITELTDKNLTRKLYEETFDDPCVFVDYYYKEKCRDNRMIVSMEEGEVISMLHLNPYFLNINGNAVKVYYVVAVATTSDRRHEGQMKRVFEKTFEILENEHIPFIFLLPVDESIYSWMGFEKICDFSTDRIANYDEIKDKYDIYCIRDEDYLRRKKMEDDLRALDNDDGGELPDNPIIMAKIIDIDSFNRLAGAEFKDAKEALQWLRSKKIYICEEV